MSAAPGQVPSALTAALSDRYRIERELGAGGMATVYLAHDLKHDRDVAIKVLHEDLGASLGPGRFLAEIKTTAKLQHPHILPLLDSGDAGGLLFYVMPYVAGETLRDRLTRDTQLPVEDAVQIAREVADALAHAHAAGIVHRDIKPENILLQGGHAVVADFGIALAVQHAGGARMTQTGLSLGTPQYMAPEQAMGDKSVGPAADIYALGAVTYEMLTGEPPFTGATVQAIVAKVLASEPEPVTRVRRTVPVHVEAAVLKALAKLPADRWKSADEYSRGLAGNGVSSEQRSPASTGWFRAPLARRIAMAGVLLGVGVLAGLFVPRWLHRDAADLAAVRHLSIVLPDSMPMAYVGEAPLSAGRRSLALSPDGRTLVYVGWYRNRTHLFARPLAEEKVRRIEGTEGAYGPFFSPNGRWVAFFAQQTLKKVALDGGTPVELASAPESYGGTWFSDGGILVAMNEGSTPTMIPENGGEPTPLRTMPGHSSAAALPGAGRFLAAGYSTIMVGSREDSVPLLLTSRGFERATHVPEMLPGASPQYLHGDYIIVSGDGRLHALPFAPSSGKALGPLVPLDEYVRQEVFGTTAQFAIGGDGTVVYAPGSSVEQSRLVLADRRGRVDTISSPMAAYWNPAFSPDGRRVAVTVHRPRGVDVQVIDLATGAHTTPATSSEAIFDPIWSTDGSRIMFGLRTWLAGADETLEVPATGGVSSRRVDVSGGVFGMSRDGSLLATMRDKVLSLMDVKSRKYTPIPGGKGAWVEFTPDNKWILWTAVGTRQYEVFVSALPLGGPRFAVTPDGCMEGKWMPDGREIVCFQSDGYLYAVPLTFEHGVVRGGKPRRVTNQRLLETPGRTWALSPDGQRMLFVAAPPGDSARVLTVVTNFRAEVERKIAEARGKPRP